MVSASSPRTCASPRRARFGIACALEDQDGQRHRIARREQRRHFVLADEEGESRDGGRRRSAPQLRPRHAPERLPRRRPQRTRDFLEPARVVEQDRHGGERQVRQLLPQIRQHERDAGSVVDQRRKRTRGAGEAECVRHAREQAALSEQQQGRERGRDMRNGHREHGGGLADATGAQPDRQEKCHAHREQGRGTGGCHRQRDPAPYVRGADGADDAIEREALRANTGEADGRESRVRRADQHRRGNRDGGEQARHVTAIHGAPRRIIPRQSSSSRAW